MRFLSSSCLRQTMFVSLSLFVTLLIPWITVRNSAHGNDSDLQSPYHDFWRQIELHLQDREYGLALAKLRVAKRDSKFPESQKQLDSDCQIVESLVLFDNLVKKRISDLRVGDTIFIRNATYTFERCEENNRGTLIICLRENGNRESKFSTSQLPCRTRIDLVKNSLNEFENKAILTGVLYAYDKGADRRIARQIFNEAASGGTDVVIWLNRLEEFATNEVNSKRNSDPSESQSQKESNPKNPILGYWRVVIGDGLNAKKMNIRFLGGGKMDPDGMRWTQTGPDQYKVVTAKGGTASLSLEGAELKGNMTDGTLVRGRRQEAR